MKNNKISKRILSLVLIVIFSLTFTTVASADDFNKDDESHIVIMDSKENDAKMEEKQQAVEEFLKNTDLEKYTDSEIEEFMKSEDVKAVDVTAFFSSGSKSSYDYYYAYVPYHSQSYDYYCGPATCQQTVDSWKYYGHTSQTLPTQSFLASMMDTTTSGTVSYKYKYVLNYHCSNYYASAAINETSDKSTIKYAAILGGVNNKAVSYLVVKNELDYYAGTSASGHYISGSAIKDYDDYSQDIVCLKDCNSNSSYSGWRSVDFNDLYGALVEYYDTRTQHNIFY